MENFNKQTLALLSLLIIPGILLMPIFMSHKVPFVPIIMCSIGGLAFGTLIHKTLQNKN